MANTCKGSARGFELRCSGLELGNIRLIDSVRGKFDGEDRALNSRLDRSLRDCGNDALRDIKRNPRIGATERTG